jgi:hypothetical protein
MRAATYKIPPATGDQEGAECVVYFFGAGQGGSVQANIERWNGQVTGSDGKPATAHIQKRTVHGLPVTTIDVTGQYSGMGSPMATAKTSKPGYRLLRAIIENSGGNVFLKFTGPRKDHNGERAELRGNWWNRLRRNSDALPPPQMFQPGASQCASDPDRFPSLYFRQTGVLFCYYRRTSACLSILNHRSQRLGLARTARNSRHSRSLSSTGAPFGCTALGAESF